MAQFQMQSGAPHVEGGKMYSAPKGATTPTIVESEHPLDTMFPGKFKPVQNQPVSQGAPDKTAPIRRTAASEAQHKQKPNRGHDVPVGSSPPAEVDEELANKAQNALGDEEVGDYNDPDYEVPENGVTPVERRKAGGQVVAATAQKASSKKGKSAKAQKAPEPADDEDEEEEDEDEEEQDTETESADDEEEEDEEEEDEPETEDVTKQFAAAKPLKFKVSKADGVYTVTDKAGEPVGKKSGYTTKRDVEKLLKKQSK